mgnify:CR=1 FL=1
MNKRVYYFSGTGNSLVVARDISKKIGGELISIPTVMGKDVIKINADMIAIVFPVYHQGLPFIISRFVNKIDNLEGKYIFAVCTYGDSPGISLKYLNETIKTKGGRLAAGFAIKMPYNYITPSFTIKSFYNSFKLRKVEKKDQERMFSNCQDKVNQIVKYVKAQKDGRIETEAEIIENIVDFLNLRDTLQKYIWLKVANFKGETNLPFQECLQLMDYGFKYEGNCASCGICEKICPVDNIKLVNGYPEWQHHCEQCFACLHWCPKEAIQFRDGTKQGERYHHPDVRLADMIN